MSSFESVQRQSDASGNAPQVQTAKDLERSFFESGILPIERPRYDNLQIKRFLDKKEPGTEVDRTVKIARYIFRLGDRSALWEQRSTPTYDDPYLRLRPFFDHNPEPWIRKNIAEITALSREDVHDKHSELYYMHQMLEPYKSSDIIIVSRRVLSAHNFNREPRLANAAVTMLFVDAVNTKEEYEAMNPQVASITSVAAPETQHTSAA